MACLTICLGNLLISANTFTQEGCSNLETAKIKFYHPQCKRLHKGQVGFIVQK